MIIISFYIISGNSKNISILLKNKNSMYFKYIKKGCDENNQNNIMLINS